MIYTDFHYAFPNTDCQIGLNCLLTASGCSDA